MTTTTKTKRKLTTEEVFQKYDPFRSPRWRYDRVHYLLHNFTRPRRPSPSKDDKYVHKLYGLVRDWEQLGRQGEISYNASRRKQLCDKYGPGIYFAFVTFISNEYERTRDAVEARILTGEDNKTVAAKCSTTKTLAAWYERCFFNVNDRLEASDYISRIVIGPMVNEGLENVSEGTLLKFFGYFGGSTILDVLADNIEKSVLAPKDGSDTSAYFDTIGSTTLRRTSGVAAQTFEVNKYNVMQLFEMHQQMIEGDRRADEVGGVVTPIEANIAAMLSAVPWVVGTERMKLLAESPLGEYMGHVAEPRAGELYALTSGEAPDSLGDIALTEFPPPRAKDESTNKDGRETNFGLD